MYAYAIRASLGDDVYEETSTQSLEQHIARLCGKEAALFVTSGTLSNQLAVRTHLTQPPYSVICDERSHTYAYVISCPYYCPVSRARRYEAGGASMHSGATVIPISASNGKTSTMFPISRLMNISRAPYYTVRYQEKDHS
jgi:threonine aldolase